MQVTNEVRQRCELFLAKRAIEKLPLADQKVKKAMVEAIAVEIAKVAKMVEKVK